MHRWDGNGSKDHDQEPPGIQKIHREEVELVKAWLEGFKQGYWSAPADMGRGCCSNVMKLFDELGKRNRERIALDGGS